MTQRRVIDNPYIRLLTFTAELEDADREIERLRDDNHRMLAAIQEFVRQATWADDDWKRQPHVKALFDIANPPTSTAKKKEG